MIDWNDIPYFLAVAHGGNLAVAARQLEVNHSTVFRRINTLEQRLNTRLFDRTADGYWLTDAGTSVLEYAEEAQNALFSFERTAKGKDLRLSGDIRVTTVSALATRFIVPCIAKFHALQADIRVSLIVSDTMHNLSKNEADIALRGSSNPPVHLIGRKIATIPWCAYASRQYINRCSKPASATELKQHKLLGVEQDLSHVKAYHWLHQTFERNCFSGFSNDLPTLVAMCETGLGIAVLPADLATRRLVPLFSLEKKFETDLWLLSHPELRSVSRIRVFSQFLYEYLKKQDLFQPFSSG